MLDFIRIACAVPAVKVGDVKKNAADICSFMEKADGQDVDVLLFPELSLTGYSCGDLFLQDALWNAVKDGLRQIARCSGEHPQLTCVVGFPLRMGHRLYNCAAVLARGEVCGIVPKTYLTTGEKRWFASGTQLGQSYVTPQDIGLTPSEDYWTVPVCAKQLFRLGDNAVVGVELCQDLMVPQPCSAALAVNGAEVILKLAASPDTGGKGSFRRELV